MLLFLFILCFNAACSQNTDQGETVKNKQESPTIDIRSYNLGAIGAFAEIVAADVKKLALSAPLSPPEMDKLIKDALSIAERHNIKIYRDEDFLVTDLFSVEVTEGKHVLLIYKGSTKDEYMSLKAKKKQLVESGKYTGAAREEIARSMGKLLSYSDRKINDLLKEQAGRE